MLKKAKLTTFEIKVTIDWNCPYCNYFQQTSYDGDPYTSIAEDPIDTICKNCEEFMTLSFYDEHEH